MKKSNVRYSQSMYLFMIYGAFILIILAIFFLFTYTHYHSTAIKEASSDLENLCSSVGDSVNHQLDNMSTISLNSVYSNILKVNFKEYLSLNENLSVSPADVVSSREKVNNIHNAVSILIGTYQTASSINIYSLDGVCVESGFIQRTLSVDLENQPWFQPTKELNGHKYITTPIVHEHLPAKGKNQNAHKFISLSRMFLNENSEPEGIIEIVQDCGTIFSLASQLESKNEDVRFTIYNSRNEIVYPYTNSSEILDYMELIDKESFPKQTSQILKTSSSESSLVTYDTIDNYGWTVVSSRPMPSIYASFKAFKYSFSVIAVLSFLGTLLICFTISKQMTVPLKKLTAATGKITINRVLDQNKVNLTSADSHIKELSMLCNSIRDMYEKLRSTSQEVLLSHSEEVRAKLQATQSLINPHFLYNCLTNMSIMAEENMNDDIIHMCSALCDYFRYISSYKDMYVPLKEEIYSSQRYLECIKLRFSDELQYTIDIEKDSEHVFIPKLIIQPIIENAFKYAFCILPPWNLEIRSKTVDNHWFIEIKDNGGQLTDEKKNELLTLYNTLDASEEINSLQIGGMGLKNVYLRLKLLYRDEAIFQIDTSTPHYTTFIIGGPICYSKEEIHERFESL